MFSDQKPPNLASWKSRWSSPDVEGYLNKRIILPKGYRGTSEALWKRIVEVIQDPLADREVWLFLGQTLSPDHLVKELRQDPPTPEAIQAVLLLEGTLAAVGSISATFRIFCSESQP
jgi:hypothetical protein